MKTIYKDYICWECNRVILLGYTVPLYVWKMQNLYKLVCLVCFVRGLRFSGIIKDFEIKIKKG